MLGAPRLLLADGRAHTLERHDAALLAMLALQGPTPRQHAVTMLWPDVGAKAAQTNLRQRLFRLKRRTGVDVVASTPAPSLAPGVGHDLDAQVSAAEAANDPGSSQLLGNIDYSDCGPLGDWVRQAREQHRSRWRAWLAQTASDLEAAGRIAEALRLAERLVIDDPAGEHAQRRLMRLHYRRGDRSAALKVFDQCRQALDEELGVEPGDETRDLAALIERSGSLPAPVAAPSPVAVLRPPRMIGRDLPWAQLDAAWQRHQVALVRGDAGIGKTRLAADFAAARGAVDVCRARPGDAGVPYALLGRLLTVLIERHGVPTVDWVGPEFARLVPSLIPSLGMVAAPGKLETLRLRQALGAATVFWQAQGLQSLVIDDLQFADEASIEMLIAWLAEAERPRVVMTLRGNEAPPLLSAWIAAASAADLCVIDLVPLDAPAIGLLVESLAIPGLDASAWARPLHQHTGGNPFFLLETLMAELLADGSAARRPGSTLAAPPRIGQLLEQRLGQLRPAALRLARVAALAGPDFSIPLAARVLGVHAIDLADDLAVLERAHVLREGGFTHDLMMEATTRTVAAPIAQVLHRAIAQALEMGGNDLPPRKPARIAAHWQIGQEWARAAAQFELAAAEARAESRPPDELRLWDAAADGHERAGDADAAFRARVQAVEPAIVVGPANRAAARADALLAASRNDSERLDALLAQGKHNVTADAMARAEPFTAEALTLTRRLGDPRREFLAAGLHGMVLTHTGRVDAGIDLFESMAPRIAQAGDVGAEMEFCSAFGYALYPAGRLQESIAWSKRAAELAERLGSLNDAAINLGNAAGVLGLLGRHDEALDAAERAHALQLRLGVVQGVPFAVSQINIGIFYLATGRYSEAVIAFDRGLVASRAGDVGDIAVVVENHLANVYVQLGQPARARQALTPLGSDAAAIRRARRAVIESRIDAYAKPPSPERLIATLAGLTQELPPIDRLGLQLAITAALAAKDAAPYSRQLHDDALAQGHPKVAASALIREADAWRRAGEPGRAVEAARSAVAEAASCGWYDIHAPEFWWMAVQAFDACGAEAEALQALRSGAAWVQRAVAHVPEPFMHGYMQRSRGVAELLAMARTRLAT